MFIFFWDFIGPVPTPQISDPVQHLMPWLNKGGEGAPQQVQQPQPQSLPPPPPPCPHPQQYPPLYPNPQLNQTQPQQPPPNFYYVANLPPPPPGRLQTPIPLQGSPQGQGVEYYGATAIPPPPAYNPSTYSNPNPPPVQPQAGKRYIINEKDEYLKKTFCHFKGYLPPYSGKSDHKPRTSRSRAESMLSEGESEFREKGIVKQCKLHVSQTSEEVSRTTPSHDDYRKDLAKQVEEKKRLEEERLQKAKEEEARFQQKIKEDQERMQREYEEDLRRAREKVRVQLLFLIKVASSQF